MAVAITRDEHTAAALRGEAAGCRDGSAARRTSAPALVKEGQPRAEAARLCGVDRQALRGWAHRCDGAGSAGLAGEQGRPGPKPRLPAGHEAEGAGLVRPGPGVAGDGIVRWRRADLARVVGDRSSVSPAGRTVGSLLRRLGFAHVPARPRHPKGDTAAQAPFRAGSAPSRPQRCPNQCGRRARPWRPGARTEPGPASKARPPRPGPGRAAVPRRRRASATSGPHLFGAALRQRRHGEPALGGDRQAGGARRPRPGRPGRRRSAPGRRAPGRAGRRHPAAPAALQPRAEPRGGRVAVPAPKPPQQPRVRQLRRCPRRLLQCLAGVHGRTRPRPLHHNPNLGTGQLMQPLA